MSDSEEEIYYHHKKAHKKLSEALEYDKNSYRDDLSGREPIIQNYLEAMEHLMAGLTISTSNIRDQAKQARATSIQEKMKHNLSMIEDRVKTLTASSPAKLNNNSSTPARSRPSPKIDQSTVRKTPLNHAISRVTNARVGAINRSATGSRIAANRPRLVSNGTTTRAIATPTTSKSTKDITSEAQTKALEARISSLPGINKELALTILDHIFRPSSLIKFDAIAGQVTAKQALYEMVILPTLRPEIFTGLRSPARGLLLFGPPGNGKTLLAKAVACESEATFFNISASSLTSKWVGEAEKLVKALFLIARELQPTIIFIDEIDSLFCKRSSSEAESSRRLKTEFFVGFDGLQSTSDDRIMVMGATNRPEELDEAILRRFSKRVYVRNPDFETRVELFRKLADLKDKEKSGIKCSLNSKDLKLLASQTEGYSCSDIAALAKDASFGPVRELSVDEIKKMPVSAIRSIDIEDFINSSKRIRKSTPTESLKTYEQWNQQYADVSR